MSEQQRVAIVTGAAGGIGRELVLGLLGNDLKVAAVDRTTQGLAELDRMAQERQHSGNLMTIEADLARDESPDEIVAKARGRFGVIDILVNNAGVGQAMIRSDNRQRPIKFWEVTPELWKLFVAVHNNAPMALSRAVVHDMMRQKWGRIVNITTSLGTMIREGSPTHHTVEVRKRDARRQRLAIGNVQRRAVGARLVQLNRRGGSDTGTGSAPPNASDFRSRARLGGNYPTL
jgi:NAD(P)-dependent dehydrogenase (short-subunit alcohol dehydrogenase family)